LGDAVLLAEPYVGDSAAPFLVALGDAVFEKAMIGGLTGRLIADAVGAGAGVGVLVRRVERSLLARYGVVRPAQTGGALGDGAFAITDIVEKPAPDDAPSDFAASARYLVTTEVFAALRETPPGRNGEIEFTDAMRRLLAGGVGGCATPLRTGERRHDLGNLTAYFEAFVAFALADPECGDAVRRSLERHVRDRSDAQLEMPTRKEVIAE